MSHGSGRFYSSVPHTLAMGWVRENLHWVLFVTFLLSTAATVGVGIVAVLAFFSALLAGGPILSAFAGALEALMIWVVPLLLLGTLDVVLFVAALYRGIRQFSFRSLIPSINYRSDRLSRWAGNVEARLPFLRPLGLSAKLEPTLEQRRERLKELYVEGEIGEEAFERKLGNLVEGEPEAPDVIEDTELPTDGEGSPRAGSGTDADSGEDGGTTGAAAGTAGRWVDDSPGRSGAGSPGRPEEGTADGERGDTVEIDVEGPRESDGDGDDDRERGDPDLEVE